MHSATRWKAAFVGAIAMAVLLVPITGALALRVAHRSNALRNMVAVTETDFQATTSTSFVDLPGAFANIFVAPGAQARNLLVTFSGESACYSGTGWCTLRVLVDGTPMDPDVGSNFAFDSSDGGNESSNSWESHSMQWVLGPIGSGSHTVQVQWASNPGLFGTAPTFTLDDWTLTVEVFIHQG